MDMEITFPGGKKVDALWKGFTIKTDQAHHYGGDASEPAPFDLFLASIGTCAGIYVLSFCQERNLPTDGLKLIQRLEKDVEAKRIKRIIIEIILPAGFPEKYKKTVIRSADLCAVKKYMHEPPEFVITSAIQGEE